MCRLNPRVDFVFKKLFGAEENKDILIDFINAVVSEEDRVQDITIKNPYNDKAYSKDKLSVLDIKAQSERGTWFNIEMQMLDQDYYDKRALYYWARLYSSQLSEGINYDQLEKTIGINILNFNALEEKKYHNVYKVMNTESLKELAGQLEIHFVELEKYDENIATVMDRWVNFLKKAGEYTLKEMPVELKEISTIKKAMEVLETMNLSEEERERFEARIKWLRDERAALISAERRGQEKGIKEGIEKGIEEGIKEVARNLLDVLDDEMISKKTGLPIEEIKKMRT